MTTFMMKKPTPEELEQLRTAFPQGSPRLDYREMTIVVEKRAKPPKRARAEGDAEEEAAETPEEEAREVADDGVLSIAISSEQPVLRFDYWEGEYYYEVLDHDAKSIDLSYATDGLPFVASHRAWDADSQHGIVESVSASDRVLRGEVRFSRAQRSQEIAADMRDGIRKKVSVGYIVGDEYEQTKTKGSDVPTRRYTSWMPVEVSTVPIPADYTVGVGRAQSAAGQAALARFLELHPKAPKANTEHRMPENTPAPTGAPTTPTAPVVTAHDRGVDEQAAKRIERITELATTHACTDKLTDWIRSGASVESVTGQINDVLAARLKTPTTPVAGPELSPKDQRRFSFARAIILNSELQKEMGSSIDFGLEREVMQEVGRHTAGMQQKGGNLLPYNLLGTHARAGIDSGNATTGGTFKFTQPGDFIPMLRNRTSVMRAGATVLPGLTGPLTMPKQNGAAATQYFAENPGSDISVTNLTTTTVTLAFKSLAAGTAFSRQMLFSAASGNYAFEQIVQDDLASVIGLAMDLGALSGTGTGNQPRGLLNNTSIGSIALGPNGGTVDWNAVVDLETAIGDANADTSRMAYLTNTKQRGRLKKAPVLGNTVSGTPIWSGTPGQMDGQVNGYTAIASNQVSRTLTKGTSTSVCSAIVFGAFEHQLVGIFGTGYETIVDPYSKKFQGMVEVTAFVFFDANQRYDEAFAAAKDAL